MCCQLSEYKKMKLKGKQRKESNLSWLFYFIAVHSAISFEMYLRCKIIHTLS